MAKTVDLSMEGMQRFLEQVQEYFQGLSVYQQAAWGVVGLGALLVLLAVFVW